MGLIVALTALKQCADNETDRSVSAMLIGDAEVSKPFLQKTDYIDEYTNAFSADEYISVRLALPSQVQVAAAAEARDDLENLCDLLGGKITQVQEPDVRLHIDDYYDHDYDGEENVPALHRWIMSPFYSGDRYTARAKITGTCHVNPELTTGEEE
jgi:hypothetical protein